MIEFTHDTKPTLLTKAITSRYPSISYSHLRSLLRKKDILVDGVRVKEDIQVQSGAVIRVYTTIKTAEDYDYKVDTIYEDDNLFIFNKPKGLETEGDISLLSYARRIAPTAQAVHRLDINTDGLIVIAKSNRAKDLLMDAIKSRQIEKHYVCLVDGTLTGNKTISAYLLKDATKSKVTIYDKKVDGSVKIITEYTVIKNYPDHTLLDVNLITGRTHQIRAHLSHIGHPILGDGKYGREDINKRFQFRKQALTAYKLIFHTTGELEYLSGKMFSIKSKLFEI